MTITTAHPGHHVSAKNVTIAFAGAVLAVGAGFGAASLLLEEAVPVITEIGTNDTGVNDIDRYAGFDPNGYAGTDREDRAFQHRN